MAIKRFTALALALLMVFSVSAAMAQDTRTLVGNTYTSGLPVLETPETFKIAICMDTNSKNTMAEKYCVTEAAKQTNMNIEWIEIPSSGWAEKVNIMIASNELPDAFLGDVDVVSNLEIFQPLGDLINGYAPNIQEMLATDTALKTAVTGSDGKIYCLPTGRSDPANTVDAGMWINTAWLKKLGLEMPKTTEEFYNTLVAFRDGDPNGNGIKDEIPLGAMQSQANSSLDPLFGAFGTMDYLDYVYQNKDGKVVFGGTEDSYRKGIDWLHTLYSEGLIDPECFTMTGAQFSAKIQSMDIVYGALMFWMPDSMDPRYYDDYEAVMPLKSAEDISPLWPTAKMPNGTITGFTVTTACKNPAALVRYYDNAIANLENVMAWYNGEEGKGIWKRVDGTKWAETAEYIPEGANMSEFERTVAVGPYSPAYMWSKYNSIRVQEPRMIKKINANNGYLEFAATCMVNGLWAPEDASERVLLFTDIDNYMKKFKADAIVSGLDDAAWANHLATLDSLKVNEYVALWQKFCDK